MRTSLSNERQKGSAALLTIFLAAIIITIGIGFNWIVKEHLKAAEGLKLKTEAMLNAYSTFDTLMYTLLAGKKTEKEIVLLNGEELLNSAKASLNGEFIKAKEGVQISVRDANGLLSLSSYDQMALKRLIGQLSGGDATVIIDSYLDWIDRSKLVRPYGAKDAYYESKRLPYKPRNYPIQYKEEFSLIRGMSKDLYNKVDPFVTMLPSTGFNPNTASDPVLKAYLNIDDNTLKLLRQYMAQKPVLSDDVLFNTTGRRIASSEGVFFYPSPFMEITIKAGSPEPLYTINAGIDTSRNPNFPYSVVYWRDE